MKNINLPGQVPHPLTDNPIDENKIENQVLATEVISFLNPDILPESLEDIFKDLIKNIEDKEVDIQNKIEKNIENPMEVAQAEVLVVNEGTVQALPDSGYTGSWGQVDSLPRQLDLSNIRTSDIEEYSGFYRFETARNDAVTPLPFNPPTGVNDSYNFSAETLPVNLTLMLDISGSMRLKGLAEFSKMLTLQQTLVGEEGLIYTLSQLAPEVNILIVPTPSNTDFYTDDDVHNGPNDPQVFSAQYFANDPHGAMEYILSLFPGWDEFYDAAMQYGLETLNQPNPMFVQGEKNIVYFIADGIPVYGPIGSGAHGADPNVIDNWQAALDQYGADAVVIGIGNENGMADALAPITNDEDPSSVLEPDTGLSNLKDLVLSGTQQISGNLLTNDGANEDTGPSNPLMITSFQQNGNVGVVGIPFITALGATLIVNADGSFTYEVPFSQLQNIGDVVESFDYTLSNGYGTDTAVLNIEIDGIDTPNVEFSYAVDDIVTFTDDVNALQTLTGNVFDNDYLLGGESIIAATAHTFISGSASIDGYFWPFTNNVVYDNGVTRFTLNSDGSFTLEELELNGLTQMMDIMEITNSGFKIAYALSGANGADIGFLEFISTSNGITANQDENSLQYQDIVNDEVALFDNNELSSISSNDHQASQSEAFDSAEFSSPHQESVPLEIDTSVPAFG